MDRTSPGIDSLIQSTIDRFHYLFDSYEHVIVNISGGKDSAVLMECGRLAALERGIKLRVEYFDLEVVPTLTTEYIERVAARNGDGIDFRWYCIPLREENGWTKQVWYPWRSSDRDKWIRPLPAFDCVTTDHPGNEYDLSIRDISSVYGKVYPYGSVVCCVGNRAEENIARRMRGADTWLLPTTARKLIARSMPIHNWLYREVWAALVDRGWDWSRQYWRMWQAGATDREMRVGPIFGEQSSNGAYLLRKYDPEMWHLGLQRVDGAEQVARYSRSILMGKGRVRPGGVMPTRADVVKALRALPPRDRKIALAGLRRVIRHARRTTYTRVSMADLLRLAIRSDREDRYRMALVYKLRPSDSNRWVLGGNPRRAVSMAALRAVVKKQGADNDDNATEQEQEQKRTPDPSRRVGGPRAAQVKQL